MMRMGRGGDFALQYRCPRRREVYPTLNFGPKRRAAELFQVHAPRPLRLRPRLPRPRSPIRTMPGLLFFALATASPMPGQNSVAQLSSELQHNMHRGGAGTATSTAPLLRSDELLNAISTLVANAHPTALRDAEGLLLAAQNALRSASHRYGAPAFSSEDGVPLKAICR